ncbi:hypothetical protein L2E82_05753 [Cichorium intybus]|uniref:Uncharacterized protein n=1 Tax=Cichorium intybus TaxID=13427 RepID=A0ACB9H7N2_CICIN|nr:hypothetical protein L2E82_05753 [Cichorium intybus]
MTKTRSDSKGTNLEQELLQYKEENEERIKKLEGTIDAMRAESEKRHAKLMNLMLQQAQTTTLSQPSPSTVMPPPVTAAISMSTTSLHQGATSLRTLVGGFPMIDKSYIITLKDAEVLDTHEPQNRITEGDMDLQGYIVKDGLVYYRDCLVLPWTTEWVPRIFNEV